jgi:hypothetical protein
MATKQLKDHLTPAIGIMLLAILEPYLKIIENLKNQLN